MKNNKLNNCFVGIFHFIFGQLAYCLDRAKEADLKESDWDNHMISIQSSNGYLFHKVYFTISKCLTISVLCFEQMLNWYELTGVYFTTHQCLTEIMHYGAVA